MTMTMSDAYQFASGMFGDSGAVSFNATTYRPCIIGFVEGRELVWFGCGETWQEAADECLEVAIGCAVNGYGPWDEPS